MSPSEIEDEIDQELSFHLAQRAQRLIDEGWDPARAEAEARRRFGSVAAVRGECFQLQGQLHRNRMWRTLLRDLGRELRLASRRLVRTPGFSVTAMLTLTLAIGACAAIFSVFDAVVLRSLPYQQPERLVSIWPGVHSRADLAAFRTARSFERVAGYDGGGDYTLNEVGDPVRLTGVQTSASFFPLLGVRPLLGRLLSDDDRPELGGAAVVVSERFFHQYLGAGADSLGQSISLDGQPYAVVGVLPQRFQFPTPEVDLWLPLSMDDSNLGAFWGNHELYLIGRLTEGISHRAASGETREIGERLRLENPIWTPSDEYLQGAFVERMQIEMAGATLRQLLAVLLGAVALVLLIASVNVAGLLLARAAASSRETAIRASLGAGRLRLVASSLIESLVLAAASGLAGLGLAYLTVRWVASAMPGVDGRFGTIGVDGRVALFSCLLVAGVTVLAGLLPALRAAGGASSDALRGRSDLAVRPWVRGALVVGQIALAVVLVVGAGLLLRTLRELSAVPTGFAVEQITIARVDPPDADYQDRGARRRLYDSLLERVAATEQVESVAISSRMPLLEQSWLALRVESRPETVDYPVAAQRVVSPGFFETLDLELLAGRFFASTDTGESRPVGIVSRELADQLWPGESPIGKRIGYPWPSPWIEVVGMASDLRQSSLREPPSPEVYFPYAQSPQNEMHVLVRSQRPSSVVGAVLRNALGEVDDRVALSNVRPIRTVVVESMARSRATTLLLSLFALVALLLGALGLYGVIAILVSHRRRELGVRLALGATPRGVARLVVARGVTLATIGCGLGLIGAIAASRALAGQLYGVETSDPGTLVASVGVLSATSLIASWLPARRASRLDPAVTLRAE